LKEAHVTTPGERRFVKTLQAGLIAGLIVGGLWGAFESLTFMARYGTQIFGRSEMSVLVINYSVHWCLILGIATLLCWPLMRFVHLGRGRPFNFFIPAALAGGALTFFGYKINAVWFTDLRSLPAMLSNAALLAGAAVVLIAGARLSARIPKRVGTASIWTGAVLWLAAATVGLWPQGSGGETAGRGPVTASRPNVLVLMVDALRADHLGCYGYSRPVSANVDTLAAEGVLFTRCIATSSWTRPSTASVLTGLFPSAHGQNYLASVIPPQARMMPDAMSEYGYRTAFITANPMVNRASGFAQDVDYYAGSGARVNASLAWCLFKADSVLKKALNRKMSVLYRLFKIIRDRGETQTVSEKDSGWVNAELLKWLDGESDAPFFAYVHYMDPHTPYDPRPPFDTMFRDPGYTGPAIVEPPLKSRGMPPFSTGEPLPEDQRRHLVDRYDEEIAGFDADLGDLLQSLKDRGLYDSTLIVLLSDHGEGFFEHEAWRHGNSLYQELIHVPLIVRLPGGECSGDVVESVCSQMDILPTLLDLLGLETWPQLQGSSLDSLFRKNGEAANPDFVLSEMYFSGSHFAACIENGMKIVRIVTGEEEHLFLYDLTRDEREMKSIADEYPPVLRSMVEKLEERLESYRTGEMETSRRHISEDEAERLRNLGYTF